MKMPDLIKLRTDLVYDKGVGSFFDRETLRELGGTRSDTGYRWVKYRGRVYRAARLAFYYVEGRLPHDTVDHINKKRDDDRWCNLREASVAENSRNRSSHSNKQVKVKGAYFRPRQKIKPWQAIIFVDGHQKSLGSFRTPEEANAAYAKAAQKYFGEFASAY